MRCRIAAGSDAAQGGGRSSVDEAGLTGARYLVSWHNPCRNEGQQPPLPQRAMTHLGCKAHRPVLVGRMQAWQTSLLAGGNPPNRRAQASHLLQRNAGDSPSKKYRCDAALISTSMPLSSTPSREQPRHRKSRVKRRWQPHPAPVAAAAGAPDQPIGHGPAPAMHGFFFEFIVQALVLVLQRLLAKGF